MNDDPAALATRLIQTQRTMVLATAGEEPWAAPVYFLFRGGCFYFFSNPSSRHITEALAAGRCAAAVYRDSEDWRLIEGLQMSGSLEEIHVGARGAAVFVSYVRKFPSVKSFFSDAPLDLNQFADRFKSRLYAFVPSRTLYLNNQLGFGQREEIQLSG